MSSWKSLTGSTALAAIALAQTAAADVTPAQVWEDLKGYMEGYGYEIAAQEATSGDTLTLSEITLSVPIPEEEATVTAVIPEMSLTGNDGAVDVVWPADMPVAINFKADGEDVNTTLLYETVDLAVRVSGDPGDTTWDYSAASAKMSLGELTVNGAPVPPEVGRGEIQMNGLSGSSSMKTGDMREVAQTFSVDQLSYDVAARDPEDTANSFMLKGNLNSVEYEGDGTMPLEIDPDDPMAMMSALDVDGGFEYGGGAIELNVRDGDDTLNYASSSTGGRFSVRMTPETWLYDVLVTGYDMQVQGSDIPFPVALKADEVGGKFTLPVRRTEEPTDVAAGLNLSGFEMNEMIWNMIDPAAQLPRDPATIKIDLTGKVRMLFDLFDPNQQEAMAMAPAPAEVHELTLNSLVVDAVGAMLTGNGAFTFDNSDMQTIPGMPRPQGQLNAELTGANALIDKLVAMGVFPEEQAMGARMMMSMFAVSAGDDKLQSTIEINEQGHILANGQRIQ